MNISIGQFVKITSKESPYYGQSGIIDEMRSTYAGLDAQGKWQLVVRIRDELRYIYPDIDEVEVITWEEYNMARPTKTEASAALEQSGALAALERENARLRQTIKELKSRLDVWEDEDIVPEKPEIPDPVTPVSPVGDFAKAMAVNPGSDTSMLVWYAKRGHPISLDQELYNARMSPFAAARDYYFEFWDSMDQEDLCNLGDFSILVHDPESQCVFEYEAYIGFGKKPFMQNIPKVVGRHGLCLN